MYKCSAKASLVLDQMRSRCQEDTQTNNKWHGKSGNYMYIMGRENADGKATGVVHKIADDSSHKLCGSFKIMSDGIITRFTGMSKADWNNAMRNAEAEYKVKYEAEQTTHKNQHLQKLLYKFTMQRTWARVPLAPEIGQFPKNLGPHAS